MKELKFESNLEYQREAIASIAEIVRDWPSGKSRLYKRVSNLYRVIGTGATSNDKPLDAQWASVDEHNDRGKLHLDRRRRALPLLCGCALMALRRKRGVRG